MEETSDVTQSRRRLNPEAPEFFPAKKALVSAPCTVFSPLNQHFLHYAFSAPLFYHPLHGFPHQHEVPLHFFTSEKETAAAPVTETVSSLQPKVTGARRRNKSKKFLRNKRCGKQGFARADQSQSRKKVWRAKSSSDAGDEHIGKSFEASFEYHYPRKFQVWVGKTNREKHPPIPLKHNGKETTIMIRNIPNRYTREMLKEILDQHCMLTNNQLQSQNAGADEESSLSAIDFLYLPIDFFTKSNKGYAFVNFTNPEAARKFFDAWHNQRWHCFQSTKICEVNCAKLQGMEQLVKHFERMEFPSEDFQPLSFDPARDGSKQLVIETRVGLCKGV